MMECLKQDSISSDPFHCPHRILAFVRSHILDFEKLATGLENPNSRASHHSWELQVSVLEEALRLGSHPEGVSSVGHRSLGASVQLAHGSGRAGLEWFDSSSAWRTGGIPQGLGPRPRRVPAAGAGWGAARAAGGVAPPVEARPSGGARGRPRQAPQPRGRSGPGLAGFRSRGRTHRPGAAGGAAGPRFLWKGNAVGPPAFPPPPACGFRVAGAPRSLPPGALPLCLSVAPLLPDKWLLAGN